MKKFYFPSLLSIAALFFVTSLSAQNPVIFTSGSGNWKPLPGVNSFYVQLWGGGAGGNTQLSTPCICTSETGGGGGGSFSQSIVYTTEANSYTVGYSYTVGTGGGYDVDGTDSKFQGCWAYRGLRRTLQKQKYTAVGEVAASYFGGYGGSSYRDLGVIYRGGGGGSAYTNRDGDNGTNGRCCVQGSGGAGTGNGGTSGVAVPQEPGGGGHGNGAGANGLVRIYYTCDYTPGRIGNAHTVPSPKEFTDGADIITNEESPTGLGYTYSWEQATDTINGPWTIVPGAVQSTLAIPAILQDTYFRRVIDGCDPTKNRTNIIKIKVFSQGNGKMNGVISGKVTSKNGITGVAGITITVQKTIGLRGSPQSFQYTTVTDSEGGYSIAPVYYGDNSLEGGDPNTVSFTIIASKPLHKLSARNPVNLSNISPTSTGNNFTDSTVYAISGRVTQRCDDCVTAGPFGLGNVKITHNGAGAFPAYSDSVNAATLGNYSTTVDDPGNFTFTPTYLNHQFSPVSRTINITADAANQDFVDSTTRVISGNLIDAAGNYIGYGTLQVEGYYQFPNGTEVPTFIKTAPVAQNTGAYSVRLPAASGYRVKVLTFTSAFPSNDDRYITQNDVTDFFNTRAVQPSIDISIKDSVRNLVYHRPPVMVLTGLVDTLCNNDPNKNPGVVFRSNVPKHFTVNVFEGPVALNHRVQPSDPLAVNDEDADPTGDFLRVYTDITQTQADASADTLFYRLNNISSAPMVDSSFMPGAPNTNAPYLKKFEVHYIDRYGRSAATIVRKATVTGVFNPTKTFTTAFPEVPYLILHAPPGDQSYSYWSQDKSIETATRFSVAKDSTDDGFVNVSVGPKFSFEVGPIAIEAAAIATLSTTRLHTVHATTEDELILNTTTNTTFRTAKSGVSDEVTGTSGDVYIGGGMNYILGKSIFVDFGENQPAGGCEIIKSEKLVMAPEGFRTEFAYAEDHIKNVIIPTQQALADQATDRWEKETALNQVSVWQQVIDNNTYAKKDAEFKTNRSFSNGVVIDESQTFSESKANTITYDVLLGNNIAFELGLSVGGVGVSGGANITISQTTGSATYTNNTQATTMGYHMEDQNIGDYYSVDIKNDPVYGTPVFDLVAGTSSCPPEPGAQKRDVPQIISGDVVLNNLNPAIENFFTITLANKSESGELRKYHLSADPVTAKDLQILVNGTVNLISTEVVYFIPSGESLDFQVGVKKVNPNDNRMSFPNVEFYLSDDCDNGNIFVPNTYNTAKVSFNYASNCAIAMDAPLDGWIANIANTNILPVTMKGYSLASIDSITLEYAKKSTSKGGTAWKPGFTVKRAAITDPNSFTYPWNIAALTDSAYDLQLKLVCQDGSITYSPAASGVIDRGAPSLVGKAQPATQLLKADGGEISFNFSESLDKTNLNQGLVEFVRLPDNTPVPVSVTEVDGKLVITPLSFLGTAKDSFRVIVKNVTDLSGNAKSKIDTAFFKLDLTPQPAYTGSNVATVHVVRPVLAENNPGTMELHFRLREKATKPTKIYFNLSGNAVYNTDYTIRYDTIVQTKCPTPACDTVYQLALYNQFDGYPGYVYIDSNQTESIIYIDPTEDFENESTEVVVVNLAKGADYKLQDSLVATANILNTAPGCPPGNILYVNRNASGNNSGVNWQNAMTSLKSALNNNCPGITQLWVAKGTYKPTTNLSRDSAFTLKNNLSIYGGFSGTETLLTQRNPRTNLTILSGDIGVAIENSDNSYNVIRNAENGLNSSAMLDGFVITGGNANKGEYTGNRGGGVHNRNSAPTFYNCIFSGNNAAEYGGGMFNQGSAPLVLNSVFSGNTALFGGGLYNESASTKIINSSFSGNQVINTGGAVYTFGAVIPEIANSILWGNSSGIQNAGGATPVVTYSIVQGGYPGTGNLAVDPLFIVQRAPVLGNTADLRLLGCSPAINTGSNAVLPAGVVTDLGGSPRIGNALIDMGAYERQSLPLSATIFVDAAATGNNSGDNWVNAYTNFSSALTELNICAPGTTIQVAAGVYTAPLSSTYNFDKSGAIILGGFPNGGGSRDPLANSTILKGNVQVLKSMTIDGIRVQQP